jgi:hypothetical protein
MQEYFSDNDNGRNTRRRNTFDRLQTDLNNLRSIFIENNENILVKTHNSIIDIQENVRNVL